MKQRLITLIRYTPNAMCNNSAMTISVFLESAQREALRDCVYQTMLKDAKLREEDSGYGKTKYTFLFDGELLLNADDKTDIQNLLLSCETEVSSTLQTARTEHIKALDRAVRERDKRVLDSLITKYKDDPL